MTGSLNAEMQLVQASQSRATIQHATQSERELGALEDAVRRDALQLRTQLQRDEQAMATQNAGQMEVLNEQLGAQLKAFDSESVKFGIDLPLLLRACDHLLGNPDQPEPEPESEPVFVDETCAGTPYPGALPGGPLGPPGPPVFEMPSDELYKLLTERFLLLAATVALPLTPSGKLGGPRVPARSLLMPHGNSQQQSGDDRGSMHSSPAMQSSSSYNQLLVAADPMRSNSTSSGSKVIRVGAHLGAGNLANRHSTLLLDAATTPSKQSSTSTPISDATASASSLDRPPSPFVAGSGESIVDSDRV